MQNGCKLIYVHLYDYCSIDWIVEPELQVCGTECGLDPVSDIRKVFRGITPVDLSPEPCEMDVN